MNVPNIVRACATGLLLLSVQVAANGQTHPAATTGRSGANGSYAVVVSRKTYAEVGWKQVVEALREKHSGIVIVYDGAVDSAREELKKSMSRYACFVARPEEAGRDLVVAVHRLTRALDDDPYTDVLWGIVTGYEAADALRIARCRAPLLIRRGGAGCGLNLDAFDEGRWFSEGEKNVMWEKVAGGKPEKKRCPDDTTVGLVDLFNTYKIEYFMTSGHATQRDWQIGYSYRNGQFRSKGGELFGLDLSGDRHAVDSPNPKVYVAAGNCLAGLVEDKECMALAWMHSAGVMQMVGYVVSTWYGYGGWGTKDLFVDQPGRFTLAEAFWLNNQALVHELNSRFPKWADVKFEEWNVETDPKVIQRLAAKHGVTDRDALGLLWDRDTVAFYGDPAWEARIRYTGQLDWEQTLTEENGRFRFRIAVLKDGQWSRPPMVLLPYRVRNHKVTRGIDLSPLITDNFLLVPLKGKYTKGQSFEVVFEATRP